MQRWWFVVAVLLFALPLRAAVPVTPPQNTPIPQSMEEPETVPEPDAEDTPEPEQPVKEAPKSAKEKAKKEQPAKPAENGESNFDEVVLQGLNKVTARASTIETPIGSTQRFGTIEIIVHSCWKSAPEERPENAALIEISEVKQGEPPARIFLGWMFSSSPGLSSLEHPFYDVTVIECKKEERK